MDYFKIPYFAMFRQTGTVIVRLRMEVPDSCCNPGTSPGNNRPRTVCRKSGCVGYSRTRSNNQYSDCDSDIVDRCQPYRASAARSRYVNVCAAVCLVLLVGGLSPQSNAAPHKRTMERQRREAQKYDIWDNPCDYDSNSKPAQYSAKLAKDVASQARNAFESTAKYKDKFASMLHSFDTFEELLKIWTGDDWLRNFTWFPEEGLPKEKVLYQNMSDEYMEKLMSRTDEILPAMYKGLQVVVAGLYVVSQEALNDNINSDAIIKCNITKSMHNVRAVLCMFNTVMRSRNLDLKPLPESEIPDIKNVDKLSYALLVYRDTLNYLEYLAQFFQKMYDVNPNNQTNDKTRLS